MPIAVFKRSYDEMRRECVVLGNSLPDPADDADNFLSKLDHGRFGEMLITLANQSSLGNPKPATVDKAYELASNWKRKCDPQPSASSKSSDGGGVSIDHTVMLATTDMSGYADEYRPPKIANRGGGERAHGNRFGGRSSGGGGSRFGGRGGRPGARGDRGWGRGSGRSSDVPHSEAATTASPVKEATRREDTFTGRGQGIRGGSPGRGRGGAGRGGSGQATSGGGGGGRASPGDQLSKTCYRCGVAGHIRSDCPQKLQSILAYEQEADLHFDYAFRVDHSINADESRVSNFFCSDELLLDNQGAMSIAGNSGIVTDVRPLLKPYSLGGINSSQDRLRVVWGGKLPNLNRLEVGVHEGAAANILSLALVVDSNYPVSYNAALDQFLVEGDQYNMVFSRKLELNGELSKHYAYNLRGAPGYNLPSPEVEAGVLAFGQSDTVANRRAHYTKGEVKGADAGVALMRKLGHASPLDTTSVLNCGLKNCNVTAQDVARAVAIYGPSISALKGKTTKAQTPSDNQEISQRMAQEQQVMAVDIMFFMGVAFLIAVLKPLGLTLVHHLHGVSDRPIVGAKSSKVIKAGLDIFID